MAAITFSSAGATGHSAYHAATAVPPSFKAFRICRGERVRAGIANVSLDELTPGEVVLRSAYAGLNYKDALATTDHGNVIRHFPRVGGSDVTGVVVDSTDPRFRPGDAVMAYAGGLGVDEDGGFSEYVRLRAARVMPVPDGLDLLEAATLGVAGFTAALAVHLLQESGMRPEAGSVLVNGATGGVGSMAVDMLSRLGYRVSAMSGKVDHDDMLRRLGAAEVIRSGSIEDCAKPLERARWSGAIDSVGGTQLAWLTRTVQPRGVIASVGNAGGNELVTSVLPFILRGIRLIGVNVSFYGDLEATLWQRLATDLKPAHLGESAEIVALDQLPDRIGRMLAGLATGRTVVGFQRPHGIAFTD
ncbi:acryloyl-CoA reductase [Cupriavidus sp. UYPR2.512]|uniref:acrylyl-CoA reductase family protein n=1 Tax=Cupriavidus sp. UYPR2.512 TaxID=1080187 RepID=UPI0003695B20|nr:acryloyl-CoA reductase [Cupriavidus sp. UYPR2.512]UIF89678.1 acryloyl-CoA reductase [Cupriavidus necator]